MPTDETVTQAADKNEIIKIIDRLKELTLRADEKTQKMIESSVTDVSLEHEHAGETRIFCMFHDNKTGKYRVTQADVFLVDNLKNSCTFSEAIHAMVASGIKAGEKITVKDLETIVRGS